MKQGKLMSIKERVNMNERVAQAIFETPGCFRSIAQIPAIMVCRELTPYYIDVRSSYSFPKQRDVIAEESVYTVSNNINEKIDKFVTTESAGIPICSIIADRMGIGMCWVKKEAKGYGLGKQIEGVLEKGEHAVGEDDLATEATTAVKAIKQVRNAEAIIKDYFVVHDRNQGATKALGDLNVRLHWLSQTTPRFMEMGFENERITEQDYPILIQYSKSPKEWSRNFVRENPAYLRDKLANVVKEGKVTDMAPLEVLTVAHPDLKDEFEPNVQKWLAELGVKHDVPEFDYKIDTAHLGGGAQVIG